MAGWKSFKIDLPCGFWEHAPTILGGHCAGLKNERLRTLQNGSESSVTCDVPPCIWIRAIPSQGKRDTGLSKSRAKHRA